MEAVSLEVTLFPGYHYNNVVRVQAKQTEGIAPFFSSVAAASRAATDAERHGRELLAVFYPSLPVPSIETLYPLSQISEQIRRAQRVPLQYSLYMSRRENHITMLNDIRGLAPRVRATLPLIIPRPPPARPSRQSASRPPVTFTKINIPRADQAP